MFSNGFDLEKLNWAGLMRNLLTPNPSQPFSKFLSEERPKARNFLPIPLKMIKHLDILIYIDGLLFYGSGKVQSMAVCHTPETPRDQSLTSIIAILFPVAMHSILAAFIVYVNQHINSDFNLPSSIVSPSTIKALW
jgi:hypothetical protein